MSATETEIEALRALLAKHTPRKVHAYQGDELAREVPVPPGRKRWAAVLAVLARVEWTRLELLDNAGGLLCVHDAEGRTEEAADEPAPELATRDAALLRMLISAQREVLQNRERETSIAMNAMGAAFRVMTDAIGVLAQVQRMTLDAQAQAFATMQAIPAPTAPDGDGEGLESSKLLAQLAPIIMQKLLAPPAVAPAPTSSNGAKASNGAKT